MSSLVEQEGAQFGEAVDGRVGRWAARYALIPGTHPDRGQARSASAGDIRGLRVARMHRVLRGDAGKRAGMVKDARIRLAEAERVRDHDVVDLLREPKPRELGLLERHRAVGDDGDRVSLPQRRDRLSGPLEEGQQRDQAGVVGRPDGCGAGIGRVEPKQPEQHGEPPGVDRIGRPHLGLDGFPVFRADGGDVAFRFDYQADAPVPITSAQGTIALDAEVQLTNGWRGTVPITGMTSFTGTRSSWFGTLQLRPVWERLEQLAAHTGVEWGTARILISPQIHLAGQAGGVAFSDTVGKPYTFVLDKRQLRLDEPWKADRLQFAAVTRVSRERITPYTIPFLGWAPQRLVVVSNVILALSLAVLVLAALYDAYQRRYQRRAWEHAQLGHALRQGALASIGEGRTVVELHSLSDLVATRGVEPVFLDERVDTSTYFVLRNDSAFLYRDGDALAMSDREPRHEVARTAEPTDVLRYPLGSSLATADGHADLPGATLPVPRWLFPSAAGEHDEHDEHDERMAA